MKFNFARTTIAILAPIFGILLIALGYFMAAYNFSHLVPEANTMYLNGMKMDLPEEISTVKDEKDSTVDLLIAYKDSATNTLHLGFAGLEMYKTDYQYANEEPCILTPKIIESGNIAKSLDYQFSFDGDSVRLYNSGYYIGAYKHRPGKYQTPIDSLITAANY